MADQHTTDEASNGRLMLVHAHPDDESSTSGGTMASYVSRGAHVTLVTCTLGELGEIIADDLAYLAEQGDDALGKHRVGELTQAMSILGVTDFVRLGGDHRFRDSGMAYDDTGAVIAAAEVGEGCLWRADLLTAADELVTLIRDRRPHVIVTYNEFGGYGHPDHIQAHRITMYAVQLAAARSYRPDSEPWAVDRVVWSAWQESAFREMVRAARAAGDEELFAGFEPEHSALPASITADHLIDCVIDGRRFSAQITQALRAHVSQVDLTSGFFARLTQSPDWGLEYYTLGAGQAFGANARDLFDGLDLTR